MNRLGAVRDACHSTSRSSRDAGLRKSRIPLPRRARVTSGLNVGSGLSVGGGLSAGSGSESGIGCSSVFGREGQRMSVRRVISGVLAALALLIFAAGLQAQDACPAASGVDAEAGWAAYQAGDMGQAMTRFNSALARCANDHYSRTGLAYTELRNENLDQARSLFLVVVEAQPDNIDALTGLGLIAWRRADLDEVSIRFSRVLALDPANATAADYLSRLPEGVGPPPERSPLVLPDSIEFPARAAGERFEIRTDEGWEPIYLRGVNLGAALPGRNPSEFPDSLTYVGWIEEMAAMGANMVRVYTIHPPRFYQALREWNLAHADAPLWLIHGVWTELPEDGNYLSEEFEGEFFGEMERVVDLLHGRADLRPRPGHASGFYTADVSEWTLAYIIGREWEPFSSMAFDSINPGFRSWEGEFVSIADGNPMEAWLARALDEMVGYETRTYRTQRPVAYTNWPTLDPMTHITESTREEEITLRESLGETLDFKPREYDNDVLGLDATLMRAGDGFRAGLFVSYHAYPYYPDFMVLQPDYFEAESSFGPSNYFGYLQDLKAHHPGMPVIISEYGVPASFGTAHLQPQGQHHGGLTEAQMAQIDRRLTLEMAEAGMAGGALFAWIDEWFKKNWIAIEFEKPGERNRLWWNRLDAEQHYGVFAMEPVPPVAGETMAERAAGWSEIPAIYSTPAGTVRAAADAAYLWLRIEGVNRAQGERFMIGLDVIDPAAGDRRWPGAVGPEMPVGMEFVVIESDEGLRVVVDPPVNPFRLVPEGQDTQAESGVEADIANLPDGFFRARLGQRFNLPFTSAPNADGRYDSLRVIPNRRRVGRDSLEYRAMGYDRGVLPGGPLPDGFWQRDGDVLEVRIPWLLINVTDPSSRSVLASPGSEAAGFGRTPDGLVTLPNGDVVPPDTLIGELGIRQVPDIGIVAGLERQNDDWVGWPSNNAPAARFTWDTWEADDIVWRARRRPVFDAMRQAFEQLGTETVMQLPGAAEGDAGTGDGPPSPDDVAAASGADQPAAITPSTPPVVPVANPPVPDSSSATLPSPDSDAAPPDPEAAGRAWIDGDLETAVRLYQAVLLQDPDHGLALHRLGLANAWEGRYDIALEHLDHLIDLQPDNREARIDRARITAWRGDTGEAVQQLDAYLDEYPDDASALEARATFQAWAGEFDAALSSYEALVSVSPDPGAVRRQQAQVLSWASRYDASRTLYDSLLAADPGDTEARLGLARVETFSGNLGAARDLYESLLAQDPTETRALQGLGRALSWDGQLIAGEEVLRRAVEIDDTNVASLTGLAQNLRWQGRNPAALELLERARELSPSDSDVREQLRWVSVALSPQAGATLVVEDDSDNNHMVTSSMVARWSPLPRLGLRVDGYRRQVSQPGLDRTARGLTLSASWHFDPGWNLSAGLGGARNDGSGTQSITAWQAALGSPGRYAVSGAVNVSTTALDATAALAERGVDVRQFGLDIGWTPASGWRLSGAAANAVFRGSEDNTRQSASISLTRRLPRGITLGVGRRTFGFDKNLSDGYFDPDYYGITELSIRWLREPGRLSLTLEGAPGAQKVGKSGSYTGAIRTSARLAWRFAPGREVSVSGGYSSAGLQSFSTGSADYRYTALIFGGNWVF